MVLSGSFPNVYASIAATNFRSKQPNKLSWSCTISPWTVRWNPRWSMTRHRRPSSLQMTAPKLTLEKAKQNPFSNTKRYKSSNKSCREQSPRIVWRLWTHMETAGSSARAVTVRGVASGQARQRMNTGPAKQCTHCRRGQLACTTCPTKDAVCHKSWCKGHYSALCNTKKYLSSL